MQPVTAQTRSLFALMDACKCLNYSTCSMNSCSGVSSLFTHTRLSWSKVLPISYCNLYNAVLEYQKVRAVTPFLVLNFLQSSLTVKSLVTMFVELKFIVKKILFIVEIILDCHYKTHPPCCLMILPSPGH